MGYDFKEQAEKGGIGMNDRKDLPGAGDPASAAGQRTSAETSGAAGRRKSGKEIVTDLLIITLGCFLLAAGIALFLDPNRLAPGGLSGVRLPHGGAALDGFFPFRIRSFCGGFSPGAWRGFLFILFFSGSGSENGSSEEPESCFETEPEGPFGLFLSFL